MLQRGNGFLELAHAVVRGPQGIQRVAVGRLHRDGTPCLRQQVPVGRHTGTRRFQGPQCYFAPEFLDVAVGFQLIQCRLPHPRVQVPLVPDVVVYKLQREGAPGKSVLQPKHEAQRLRTVTRSGIPLPNCSIGGGEQNAAAVRAKCRATDALIAAQREQRSERLRIPNSRQPFLGKRKEARTIGTEPSHPLCVRVGDGCQQLARMPVPDADLAAFKAANNAPPIGAEYRFALPLLG